MDHDVRAEGLDQVGVRRAACARRRCRPQRRPPRPRADADDDRPVGVRGQCRDGQPGPRAGGRATRCRRGAEYRRSRSALERRRSRKFIAGEPMNPATNRFAGRSYSSWGGAICCSTPLPHHRHPMAEGHRLDLVVGDVDRGRRRGRAAAGRSRRASARAAWHRGWTAARPSGTPAARARSPGPSRPAGAGRRTGCAACGPGTRYRPSSARSLLDPPRNSGFGTLRSCRPKPMLSRTLRCG